MGSNTFVRADVWTVAQTEQGNVVLIRPKESDLVVPIFIGQLETQSILIGLGKVDMPRPLTHDLLLAVLRDLGAELLRVEIRDLRDRTFYANLIIKSPLGEAVIDARPSDAIALAIRTKAEVYIAEDVVEAAGVPVDMVRESVVSDEEPADDSSAYGAATQEQPDTESSADGSPPVELSVAAERERLKARLKTELEAAVSIEDYELAAQIRDRLKSLA
ncbi:MAG TPA: bifunctional nuclease family protein [bacterium]|nr:bifunctional nuclease family protein [bacterium]